jgi:hypothetical protein
MHDKYKSIIQLKHGFMYWFLVLAICLCGACNSRSNDGADLSESVDEMVGELYQDYLTNDVVGARNSMLLAVEILSQTKDTDYARGNMWFAYGRLMCIERYMGNSDAMEMYYEKTKEWYDICLKHVGEWRGVGNNVEMISIDHFCSEFLKWDEQFTQGAGPNYLTGGGDPEEATKK